MSRRALSLALMLCTATVFTALASTAVHAADWSDTSVSWRYGNSFREPYNTEDISKHILALTHVSGYKYGTNFFNADFLMSDSKDPGSLTQSSGAQETYIVYRHTLDFGKIQGKDIKFVAVRGVGLTLGFDVNTKNDVGYNSRKRMLVAGPTLMWDVPGFLNTSLLILEESNAPSGAFPPISGVTGRYHYKTHPMLNAVWGIPVGQNLSFEGYANFIASKGTDEVGGDTAAETNIDMELMFDVGAATGGSKNMFKVGLEYQYWKNKFGNPSSVPGSKASTPMIRAEYHF
jgi:nucleoside-specific outer membrane channel protein Tsx